MTGIWSRPYPDYLGATYVHVAFLTYPEEGAAVRVEFLMANGQTVEDTITIPAGADPVAYNISCAACYASEETMIVSATYVSGPSTSMLLDPDTLTIPALKVESGASASDPATVIVTLDGVRDGGVYTLALWCDAPQMVSVATQEPNSDVVNISYFAEPGTCKSFRYLVVTSDDNVHVAVARA